jgi:hypothetical protein
MLGSRVADVLGKLEAGMGGVRPAHIAVAGLLGDHGGGRDRGAAGVSADDRARAGLAEREPIAQADAAVAGHAAQSGPECGEVGHVEATIVYSRRAPGDDRDARRDAQDHPEQLRPRLRSVLLGIVQCAQRANVGGAQALEVEEDGGGDKRPREGAPPRLIRARDKADAEPPVESEQLAPCAARAPLRVARLRIPRTARKLRGSRFGPVASK